MAKRRVRKGIIFFLVIVLLILIGVLAFLLLGNKFLTFKLDNVDNLEAPYLAESFDYPNIECTFLGLKANSELTKEIDLNTLGEQEAEYTCTKFIFKKVQKVTINVKDKEPPKITLNGSGEVYVYSSKKYTELGAKAEDNIDGDLTDKIIVTGEVDVQTVGTYEIKYTVTDAAGNEASITRKVNVTEKPSESSCGEKGVVYLTFDDGPDNGYTPMILDVLKKYDVKATFFVTSTGSDDLIKREFDEGHAVGVHTSSHDYAKIYVSSDAFWNDFNIVAERIKKITGQAPTLSRFPGGSSNTVSKKYSKGIMTQLVKEVEEKGYAYFDWNESSGDAGGLTHPTLEENVQQEIKNVTTSLSKSHGNVILMHDIKKTTANAIEGIVKYGIDNGYTFKVLDQSIICHQKVNN